MLSYRVENFSFVDLTDKKERMQLTINDMVATAVNSSISDDCLKCKTERDVNTRKHNPNKLEEVLSMWVDLFIFYVFKVVLYLLIVT